MRYAITAARKVIRNAGDDPDKVLPYQYKYYLVGLSDFIKKAPVFSRGFEGAKSDLLKKLTLATLPSGGSRCEDRRK